LGDTGRELRDGAAPESFDPFESLERPLLRSLARGIMGCSIADPPKSRPRTLGVSERALVGSTMKGIVVVGEKVGRSAILPRSNDGALIVRPVEKEGMVALDIEGPSFTVIPRGVVTEPTEPYLTAGERVDLSVILPRSIVGIWKFRAAGADGIMVPLDMEGGAFTVIPRGVMTEPNEPYLGWLGA
jgi:hypothetical protein